MPRIRKFNPKRKYRGNQHSNVSPARPRPSSPDRPSQPSVESSSKKKLNNSKLPKERGYGNSQVNFIVNLELIYNLIKLFTKCKFCESDNCIELELDENLKAGLVHRLVIKCLKCERSTDSMSSKVIHNLYETNIRFAYAMRSIGKGVESAKMFNAVMNLAPPSHTFSQYNRKLSYALKEVAEASMRNAANEAVAINDNCRDIAAAFDGTWQKRGYTSLNGVITVTSFDTGKVLDVECLSKFCFGCVQTKNNQNPEKMAKHKEVCSANYDGSSGGMEVAGAQAICSRSEDKLWVRYKEYLGDGDSKGFSSVLENNPYGEDFQISKLECVGHVQKRMGTRLRNLKRNHKKVLLSVGKGLGGSGRLTEEEMDRLQNYYGKAIRENLDSVDNMERAIWATLDHRASTDEYPKHERCSETWCKFVKAQLNRETYHHKKPLPQAVCQVIEPIYKDLSNKVLLKRCLHGKTQNPNESSNAAIWQRLPKTVFVGLETLKLGVNDAIINFNEGSVGKINVLERLQITPGKFTILGLQRIDATRVRKAQKEVTEKNKKKRVARRKMKRKNEDKVDECYCPGGF